MRRLAVLTALYGLTACGGGSVLREARYVGTVTPDSECGQASNATLSTSKGRFTFAPSDGVILLSGDVGADGALTATLTTTGADRKAFMMRFEGALDPQRVQGRYVTPRCGFAVELHNSGTRAFETPYL